MTRTRMLLYTVPPALFVATVIGLPLVQSPAAQPQTFELVEATIADVHRAIQQGQITCRGLVEAYINRAKAYNGTSDRLVTSDGAPIPSAPGTMRAGAPLTFPTETVPVASVLPNYSEYAGPPIELGRMEPTASDPSVQQQYGMTIGTPNSGQINALGTLNLRGERSVTCKGDRDRHPSSGPLPAGSPAVCEEFRQQPDALERAAELDAQFGRNPDLAALPMYCVPFSFKDPFDTKDMRTTAAADARYDIDFPARDHTLVAQLRAKGAIIYAKAVNTEYNGIPGPPDGGRHEPTKVLVSDSGYQRSSWSGNPHSAYDGTRAASLGSSSGSGTSVSANLVMCSVCEETSMSCRGPANHNSVALVLPHKAMISFLGGAIGADIHNDRSGIHCRSVTDSAKVLDALRDETAGYYDPRDPFTTVPRASIRSDSFAAHASAPGAPGSLKGVRIGVIRESMLTFPGIKADEPIATAAAKEIKDILGARLGATLVESIDPLWPDDPQIENMTTSYTRALAELVPIFFPELLYRLNNAGPIFAEFAAAIQPTEFAPGRTYGSGTMKPVDYMLAMAEGRIPPPRALNIRTIQALADERLFRFHVAQYLSRRAADWAARGQKETLSNWAELNARSKFWSDEQRAWWKNWEEVESVRAPIGERQPAAERLQLRELLRRVEMKVIQENRLDLVVRLHTSLPPGKIGGPPQPGPQGNARGELRYGPYAGETEVLIPAGYVREVYDPTWVLSPDKRRYIATNNNTPTMLPAPGLPFSLVFRAEPGAEDRILRAASAYEAASKRRVSPPEFGPVRTAPTNPSGTSRSTRVSP